ncbi:hypothetical protein ACJX0J_010273 [Zea mays]
MGTSNLLFCQVAALVIIIFLNGNCIMIFTIYENELQIKAKEADIQNLKKVMHKCTHYFNHHDGEYAAYFWRNAIFCKHIAEATLVMLYVVFFVVVFPFVIVVLFFPHVEFLFLKYSSIFVCGWINVMLKLYYTKTI